MTVVPEWFTLAWAGTSFIGGRLNGGLVERIAAALPLEPEAAGPIRNYNFGQGGWNSTQIRTTTIPRICALRPNHVFYDTGAINSCVDFGGGPVVSRAQHILDIQQSVTQLQAEIPGVDITLLTMSSVSAVVATIRPAYADYNADVVAQAALLGLDCEDLYAGYPKPLPATLTYGAGPFEIAVTATYDPMPEGTGWNAADIAAAATIYNVDAGIFNALGGIAGARGNTAVVGKRHFEYRFDIKTSPYPAVGIGNAAASLVAAIGGDANSIGLRSDGNVYRANANQGAVGFTVSVGDVIGVEVDEPARNIYFMKGAVRSAAFSFAAVAGDVFPLGITSGKGMGILARFTPAGDGLHPLFEGALDTYSYPQLLALGRAKMAAHFGL